MKFSTYRDGSEPAICTDPQFKAGVIEGPLVRKAWYYVSVVYYSEIPKLVFSELFAQFFVGSTRLPKCIHS